MLFRSIGRRGLFGQVPGVVPSEAITWLERAALQDHLRAQYALGMCHAKGVGLEPDLAQAYAWLSLAAEREFPKALYKLSLLEAEMTPALLQDGRRRVSALRRTLKTPSR